MGLRQNDKDDHSGIPKFRREKERIDTPRRKHISRTVLSAINTHNSMIVTIIIILLIKKNI